mmetsp:Transcript_4507/g.12646  ORF Transcript_4507/g.12646 Transcript_4507/m.12646 type:complete len:97 (-) Transcript_4507:894-1184(-)
MPVVINCLFAPPAAEDFKCYSPTDVFAAVSATHGDRWQTAKAARIERPPHEAAPLAVYRHGWRLPVRDTSQAAGSSLTSTQASASRHELAHPKAHL